MKNEEMRALKYTCQLLALSLIIAACSSDAEDLKPGEGDERVPLQIVASIDAQANGITRASETAWDAGDHIGVYVTATGKETPFTGVNDTPANNLKFTFDDGTNYETYGNTYRLFTSSTSKIFLSSEAVDVYGYYPYVEPTKTLGGEEVKPDPKKMDIDVSNQTSQKAIDFMRARKGNVNNGNAAIELLFMHRLVKLVFNLKQGESLLPNELSDATYLGMVIKDQYYKATYDIYAQDNESPFTIDVSGKMDIYPVKAAAAPTGYVQTYEAIVLPNYTGTYAVTNNPVVNRTVEITFYRRADDQIVNSFIIPSTIWFRAGYKYTFNVTVNAVSVTVDTDKYTEQW
jgi:hypothetical protein